MLIVLIFILSSSLIPNILPFNKSLYSGFLEKTLISSNINVYIDSINYFLFLISESDTNSISNKRKLSDMDNYFNPENKKCSK